jgi:murein DD-endopeptidase MepM/ murein hydrolase activator NlpD
MVIDHGDNLFTSYSHLSRTIARVGDVVRRGQVFALSGMSGLDGLAAFPWIAPHVHWNVFLDGAYVDPFAKDGETPILRGGRAAKPARLTDETVLPSALDHIIAARVIESARSSDDRTRLNTIADPHVRSANVFFERSYFPSAFASDEAIFVGSTPRSERLDLPFSPADFDDLVLSDEL